MKKNIIFSFAIVLTMLTITKCKKPDNVVYDVLDSANANQGAVLRTLERVSTVYNKFDMNSIFKVVIEEQDPEYGDLLDKVNVYVSFIDKNDDGVDNNVPEKFLAEIPKSNFTQSANDLPMTEFSSSFGDVISTLNLQNGQYSGGDIVKFRFELVLTDGRTFSEESTSSTLQQSFFNSPFAYYATIVCIPPAPIAGDYTVDMHDSYGDGWQGSKIIVEIDGNVAYELSIPDLWTVGGGNVGDPQFVNATETVTVPAGATSLVWKWHSGDYPSEATFEITGPNSGNVIYEGGPSEPDGEFIPNYCNE